METQRLIIRDLSVEDVEPLATMWSDPDVTLYSGGPRDQNAVRQAVTDAFHSMPSEGLGRWVVVYRQDCKFLGECGLVKKDIKGKEEVELIYYFAKHAWKHGFATEAAKAILEYAKSILETGRLVALIHPENIASANVAIKIGFEFVETLHRENEVRKLYAISF